MAVHQLKAIAGCVKTRHFTSPRSSITRSGCRNNRNLSKRKEQDRERGPVTKHRETTRECLNAMNFPLPSSRALSAPHHHPTAFKGHWESDTAHLPGPLTWPIKRRPPASPFLFYTDRDEVGCVQSAERAWPLSHVRPFFNLSENVHLCTGNTGFLLTCGSWVCLVWCYSQHFWVFLCVLKIEEILRLHCENLAKLWSF